MSSEIETRVIGDSVRIIASLSESAGGDVSARVSPVTHPAFLRLGGARYPMKSEPRCIVCGCFEYREVIDYHLNRGTPYLYIANLLPDKVRSRDRQVTISPRNLRQHHKSGHVTDVAYLRREAYEAEIIAMGEDPETYIGGVGHVLLLKEIVRAFYEAMASGRVEIKASDAIGAARALIAIDALKQESVNQEVIQSMFTITMDCWHKVVAGVDAGRIAPTEEAMQRAFGTFMQAQPEVAALQGRASGFVPKALAAASADASNEG